MPLCPSAPLKFPARESKVGHLKTRGYLENSPHQGSVLLACFAAGFDIVRVTVGKFLIAFFLFSPMMDNNSFSEANFPGKRCLFSASSPLSVLSALSQCPHAGICGVCGQRSWGVTASSHPSQRPVLPTPHSSPALSLSVPPGTPLSVFGKVGRAAPGSYFPGKSRCVGSGCFRGSVQEDWLSSGPGRPLCTALSGG